MPFLPDNSAKIPQPQRELQPIVPPERPWQHIGIDLFTDMPDNEFGYKHVLVIVCYLSKYVIAGPLKRKTSEEVIAELLSVYLIFGVIKICQYDQGKEFTSKVILLILRALRSRSLCDLCSFVLDTAQHN